MIVRGSYRCRKALKIDVKISKKNPNITQKIAPRKKYKKNISKT